METEKFWAWSCCKLNRWRLIIFVGFILFQGKAFVLHIVHGNEVKSWRRVKRDLQLRSAFCLTRTAVPEVAVVRQDCASAHQDCRTTSHLQKKQKESIYKYIYKVGVKDPNCFYTLYFWPWLRQRKEIIHVVNSLKRERDKIKRRSWLGGKFAQE